MSNNLPTTANGQAAVAQVTIREAVPTDRAALRRLAQLDSSYVPAGTMLIAEVGGEARAAVSMSSGDVIADPFHATQEVVQMLKIRKNTQGAIRATGLARNRPTPSSPSIPGFPVVPAN